MTDTTRGSGAGVSGHEVAIIAGISLLGAGAIGSAVLGQWHQAVVWMLAHQVLVPARGNPAFALPASGGAGIDWPRVLITVAAVMVAVAFGVHELRTRFITQNARKGL